MIKFTKDNTEIFIGMFSLVLAAIHFSVVIVKVIVTKKPSSNTPGRGKFSHKQKGKPQLGRGAVPKNRR